jgi:hypothetical protein
MGVDQKIHGPLIFESGQFFPVAGGIDDGAGLVSNQDRVTEGVPASPDKLYRPFFKIEHANFFSPLSAWRKNRPPIILKRPGRFKFWV